MIWAVAVVTVIDWSKTLRGVESKVLLVWKQIVMGCFIILLKMLHPCLFVLKMCPDLGRVKKTEAGKCIHVMFEKVIDPSWNEK